MYIKLHNQDQAEVHTPICLIPKFVFLTTFCSSSSDIYNYQERLARKDFLQFSSVQLLSCVWLFATPWTAARQASLSITDSRSLPKLMSIESVMPSNHLILCRPLLLPPSIFPSISSVQFSSVAQLCPTLCDPMNHSTPGLPVHHQLPESTQTHVHWVGDAIKPSYPLSSPSSPALNLSQHQGLFKWVSSSHQMAKVMEFQLQQSFQWIPRIDLL